MRLLSMVSVAHFTVWSILDRSCRMAGSSWIRTASEHPYAPPPNSFDFFARFPAFSWSFRCRTAFSGVAAFP